MPRRLFFFLAFSLLFSPLLLLGQTVNPLTCVEQNAGQIFPSYYVIQALSIQNVSSSSFAPLLRALQERSRQIPQEMRKEALQIIPNPFQYPYDYRVARQMWMRLVHQTFVQVMIEYAVSNPGGVLNRGQIEEMFSFLRQNYLDSFFQKCFPLPAPDVPKREVHIQE